MLSLKETELLFFLFKQVKKNSCDFQQSELFSYSTKYSQ